MVCFDTKGDEVPVLTRWARLAGDRVHVVSVSDPSAWAVDMFALDPDPVRSATLFVDSMVYAFEAGSIMARSQETLTAVFAGAWPPTPRSATWCPTWARYGTRSGLRTCCAAGRGRPWPRTCSGRSGRKRSGARTRPC